jgi:hypothetical protein
MKYSASAINIYNTREFIGGGIDKIYTLCVENELEDFLLRLQQVLQRTWKIHFLESDLQQMRCIPKNTYKVFDLGYGLYVFISHQDM